MLAHEKIGNQIVPLLFYIMSSKSMTAYSEISFELCKVACDWDISLNPTRIVSDFEKVSVASIKTYLPLADYKGYSFHFHQIIWWKVQFEYCPAKYGNDKAFSLQTRMLKSLAFVP